MLFRKAVMADIPAAHEIINGYAAQGLMLRRPLMMLYESVRDFTVAVDDDGQVLGVAALHIMWRDLAEIRSLAVRPGLTRRGVGRGLVEQLLEEARALGLKRIFALTYQPGFFAKCGFEVVPKESLPQKVWKECVYCDKFHNCDEIAMMRLLVPPEELDDEPWEIPLVARPNWVKG
ncbi:N-acetyltransferase [Symbiobacterium thermophilum]|uniref:GNAT family acetyltransferase n=3 Tax=Symbiobacterium thermophilum TaxID=2734 RepID=Q67KC4_SYMTH|nr:N-acetyltransferase [Symbiobacterium thermophilum]MBY6277082.1 GNAT family N-acetyltransferase [Symbiobacterium thermophilum]BAD41874.1 GNAT family acetyltransferase [Symbiobacterium thermophilum IAM 14863]